jgi:cytoplasmic FMR1 interacting protein
MTGEQSNKHDVYRKSLDILLPQVHKMKELMNFAEVVVGRFIHHFQSLLSAEKAKDPISDLLLSSLITVMDGIIVVDSLKNAKPSLMNDFTAYRRYVNMCVVCFYEQEKIYPLFRSMQSVHKHSK